MASYKKRAKFRLSLYDRNDPPTLGGQPIEQVDMFQSLGWNEGLNLQRVNVVTGMDVQPKFTIQFDDTEHIIDMKQVGNGNIVVIEAAKESANDYENIFYGICRNMEPARPVADILRWQLTGFSNQVIFNEILCTFIHSAEKLSLQDKRINLDDTNILGWKVYENFLTNKDVPDFGGQSLQDIGNFTTNGIDQRANDKIGSMVLRSQYANNIHKAICDSIGAIGGLDETNDAYFRYPTHEHNNFTIKVPQSKTEIPNDYAAFTSYVVGSYSAPRSIERDDFGNILAARATVDRTFLTGSTGTGGSKNLAGQALGQLFMPSSLAFSDFSFWLKKVGNPTSSKNRVNGAVILDTEFYPGGKKIATFNIALDKIKDNFSSVAPTELKILTKTIEASKYHWVILYERSGTHSGDYDLSNTIEWGNNGDETTPGQYSAFALGGDRDDPSLPWQILPNGPTFAYGTFQTKRRQSYAVDALSVKKYGPIMIPIDATFIDDNYTLNKFLHVELQERNWPKINMGAVEIRIPNNKFPHSGKMVTFVDESSGWATWKRYQQLLVNSVEYDWDARRDPIGIRTCKVVLSGRYNWLFDYFNE